MQARDRKTQYSLERVESTGKVKKLYKLSAGLKKYRANAGFSQEKVSEAMHPPFF